MLPVVRPSVMDWVGGQREFMLFNLDGGQRSLIAVANHLG